MAFSNSAVNLIHGVPQCHRNEDLFKGVGHGRIRLGYAVGSIENNLLPCLKKIGLAI